MAMTVGQMREELKKYDERIPVFFECWDCKEKGEADKFVFRKEHHLNEDCRVLTIIEED